MSGPSGLSGPSASVQALRTHRTWLRRARLSYALTLAMVALVVGTAVSYTFRRGEISALRLRTALAAAPVPPAALSPSLTLSWEISEASAIGSPLAAGTVVTYTDRRVAGRSAVSGKIQWSFTEKDRRICAVAQLNNRAVIVLRHQGACDEARALDAQTGDPVWQRTLDDNAHPVEGSVHLQIDAETLFIRTAQVIYAVTVSTLPCDSAIGQGCGVAAWTYAAPAGCVIVSTAAGSSGVLISLRCATGSQLLLRDRYLSADDQHSRILWTVANNADLPVAANAFLLSYDVRAARLIVRKLDSGKPISAHDLSKPAAGPGVTAQNISTLSVDDLAVVTIGPVTIGFTSGAAVRWQLLTPLALSTDPIGHRLLYLAAGQVRGIDLSTGKAGEVSTVGASPSGQPTGLSRLGAGILIQGQSTSAYR